MTTVTIYRNKKNENIGFTTIGHAGYAEEGEDIVCAALSVLIINTINSIDAFAGAESSLVTDEEEGLIDFRLNEINDKTELLISSMILGINSMVEDENYAKYIQLIIEEV
ncbi:MAG: ribosomal-processing cysteine protease Prp [Eubacteriales bacterium]|nr:ribosomal-processing cysteine protease Prp [Eubacteriales bacterium]